MKIICDNIFFNFCFVIIKIRIINKNVDIVCLLGKL